LATPQAVICTGIYQLEITAEKRGDG